MDKQYLNDEFNRFFEFPPEDKSQVSSVSAKLFAEHIAYPLERDAERYRWLRNHGAGFCEFSIYVDEDGISQRGSRFNQIPEMLDAAIDAAMEK